MTRKWKLRIVALAVLSYPSYRLITHAAILYAADDLTRVHGCTYILINSGDETRFLKRMGNRSIGALERQIDDPIVSLNSKVHLAWILSSVGEHSRFSVFLDGINATSEQTRYMAAFRMRDFPGECLRNLQAILEAGTRIQHDDFWTMITSLVEHTSLPTEQRKALLKKLARRDFTRPLTTNEVGILLAEFQATTEGEPAARPYGSPAAGSPSGQP